MKNKNRFIEPQDKSTLNINEKWQLNYWTKELNISVNFLQQLVRQAGTSLDDIRHALKLSRIYSGQ
jgi:hypothetical protein